MPPKVKPQAPSKKTEQKKKEKVIEDKTFGLKNKKGSKQQKFIQQVEKQVKTGGVPPRKLQDDNNKKLEKEKKEQEKKEMSLLFKPVITQKIEKGADPKSILCAFFKQGQCVKGDKCKFSHDLAIERKAEKRSLYCDVRDDEEETMEGWDEDKLKDVIGKKHGDSNSANSTEIICKYFLEAVEKSKYGWFWACPNGPTCIYRHALPPGFVLKKDKKKEDKKDEITIEELVERERAALGTKNLTKVTLESITAWKKRKLKEKKAALAKDEERKRTDFKAGRQMGLSGRDLFVFNPDMATDDRMDDGDEAVILYQREEDVDGEDVQYRELQLEMLENEAQEEDGTGTVAAVDRLAHVAETLTPDEENKLDEASGGAELAEVPINENLFLDDDLDDLEDELDQLDIDQ